MCHDYHDYHDCSLFTAKYNEQWTKGLVTLAACHSLVLEGFWSLTAIFNFTDPACHSESFNDCFRFHLWGQGRSMGS